MGKEKSGGNGRSDEKGRGHASGGMAEAGGDVEKRMIRLALEREPPGSVRRLRLLSLGKCCLANYP